MFPSKLLSDFGTLFEVKPILGQLFKNDTIDISRFPIFQTIRRQHNLANHREITFFLNAQTGIYETEPVGPCRTSRTADQTGTNFFEAVYRRSLHVV